MLKKILVMSALLASIGGANAQDYKVKVNTDKEPVAKGKFEPNWESLGEYQTPEWYKNAKFGIWAHWGPQCAAEDGDWYARSMYIQGDGKYRHHIDVYGHPSESGFIDVINDWKAENWDPDKLVKLYKEAGAQYFMAMANHHDNLDMYDSKYQEWNTVNMGPNKDIIGGWAEAARKYGLPFGVSVHASHAWRWFEVAQQSDKKGPLKGVPYDGKLTKADGKGKWWEGYDPQELYAQNHPLSKNSEDPGSIHGQWAWENGAVLPDQAYCDKFYNRTIELINKYSPEVIYFDDTVLPLYPFCDAGLNITAHMYNKSMERNGGKNKAVVLGKILNDEQKKCLTWDVERGTPDKIQPQTWQTCTCLGDWHYNKWTYYDNWYKSSKFIVNFLIDVVSKNGNLLLSVPVKSDGTIDKTEETIVKEIGEWMKVNGESIYGTTPWKVYGEGPAADKANPIKAQGFNEGAVGNLGADDIRFNQKKGALYISFLGVPQNKEVSVKSCGKDARLLKKIKNITVLGSDEKITWKQNADALVMSIPSKVPCTQAVVYKVTY